ncbi:MAG: hypothetical protein QG641_2653 [Candidatus Poribacteria bacterium]|nr:hypothetical protein [Candidatus Poribacteria bacterium]
MCIKSVIKRGIVLCFISLALLIIPSSSKAAAPEPKRSDGAVFKETFDDKKDVADWEKQGSGLYEVQKGELVFNQSDGDNAVDHPEHKVGNKEYVLQTDFRIPDTANMKAPFMIIGLITSEGGSVKWLTNFRFFTDLEDQYTVGVQDPEQVEFAPKINKDKTYTIAIEITPKNEAHYFLFADNRDTGTFLGTIQLSSSQSDKVRIGNVFGAGSGWLIVDNIMLGNPTRAILLVLSASRLSTTWGALKEEYVE